MGRLSCPCLNVSVHYKDQAGTEASMAGRSGSTPWSKRPAPARQLFPEDSRDRLVSEQVYEIELDVAGVMVKHKSLVLSRSVGDWVVHCCSSCRSDVYLLHAVKEERKVFVTGRLVGDQKELDSLTQHKHYSPVFRIVLNPSILENGGDAMLRKRVQSVSFGREDPVMKKIHSDMKSFLNQEELAMEERIRVYEDEQRGKFSELQMRAHRDRGMLFTAIAKARENIILDAMTDSLRGSSAHNAPPTSHAYHHMHTSPRSSPKKASPELQHHHQGVATETNITITLRDSLPMSNKAIGGVSDRHGDDMFLMEGFDEVGTEETDAVDPVPFPQSDDETSTEDSSYREDSAMVSLGVGGVGGGGGGGGGVVPSSLPMMVPHMFQPSSSSSSSREQTGGAASGVAVFGATKSVPRHFDPDQVGSSIKALALSVQDTGLFGDLPRPRINSTPYAR